METSTEKNPYLHYSQFRTIQASWEKKSLSQYPNIPLSEVKFYNERIEDCKTILNDASLEAYKISEDMTLSSTSSDFQFVDVSQAFLRIQTLIQHLEHKYQLTKYDDIISTVRDGELKGRLKTILTNPEQELDSAIREVTVIVEDRIRLRANLGDEYYGKALISKALNPGSGILIHPTSGDSLYSCHSLCKMINDLKRNAPHHKLINEVPRDELTRVIFFADESLVLINQLIKK